MSMEFEMLRTTLITTLITTTNSCKCQRMDLLFPELIALLANQKELSMFSNQNLTKKNKKPETNLCEVQGWKYRKQKLNIFLTQYNFCFKTFNAYIFFVEVGRGEGRGGLIREGGLLKTSASGRRL